MQRDEDFVPKEWLKERASVEQVEAENMHDGVPFGGLADEWRRLKSQMIEGDEIWHFSSSEESWEHLAGRAGIALVRNGRPIDGFVTILN